VKNLSNGNLTIYWMNLKKSKDLLIKGQKIIPAVSQTFSKAHYSYVKGVFPTYVKSGKGSHIFDVDNNEYVDYVLGLGPVILGYCYEPVDLAIKKQLENGISFSMPHYLEIDFSEKIQKIIPGSEMVRIAKTGSDAVTACVRAARAYTKRNHILYCGHGGVWHDWFTSITNRNQGIPKFNNELIHLFEYNNIENITQIFKNFPDQIAAVVMEPMWLDYPDTNYFDELKSLIHQNGALLIFDEVLTGFRLANGGGQEFLNVEADLVAFGKAIGNGMPLAAITGKEEYMKKFNDVFYSTTYGGESLSLAAGIAVIDELMEKNVVKHCWKIGQTIKDGVNKLGKEIGVNVKWNGLPVRGAIEFKEEKGFSKNLIHSVFLQECIRSGTLFGPGESLICFSHNDNDVKQTLNSIELAFNKIHDGITHNNLNHQLDGDEIKSVMSF